jgi:hypothetical protein
MQALTSQWTATDSWLLFLILLLVVVVLFVLLGFVPVLPSTLSFLCAQLEPMLPLPLVLALPLVLCARNRFAVVQRVASGPPTGFVAGEV